MKEQENVDFILERLAAFGRGEMDAYLAAVADDVDWQSPVTRTKNVHLPWCTPRHSPAEVEQFFDQIAAAAEPYGFEITAITAQDDRVVLEGHNRGTVKATGRSYEHEWMMVYTIRDGKIVRFRHYYDTADVLPAFA